MLFQITAHEYDRLFLNRLIFGLDIKKLLLATERKLDIVSSDIFLIEINRLNMKALYW